MREKYILRNEDCRETLRYMKRKNIKVDCVLTSPPYNASRKVRTEKEIDERKSKYKYYDDSKDFDEYCDFIVDVLSKCEYVLNKNGVMLINLSYVSSVEIGMIGSNLFILIAKIINETKFDVADVVVWKKKSALPNNRSSNKLTRICEFVFVLCRKSEYMTFMCNKKMTKNIPEKGLKYYENIFNFVEAKNNDGSNPYNKATFSIEFVRKLLKIYVKNDSIVLDPFAGICTTAQACKQENRNISCICCEIDKEQIEYGKEMLKNG